ncbi:hypothetical protein [Brevundimonas sp.]|uniref:hypothetical protein n=1 Tax=Brevundimonas sp. TaxID=1871086 RepID=UPI002D4C23D1|nr:hypothetical protein [Brevundimonas sp.]HYC97986.1 hypothetical protein [Brevundimonas sp.]
MKIVVALAAVALTACASIPEPAAFDPAATSFTGYVRFTEGEFQLYEREAQVQAPFARPCVSGALPRDAQRSAAEMSGQKVTFTGRAVAWPAGGVGLEHEGSTIRNTCGVDHVILAQTVSVIR